MEQLFVIPDRIKPAIARESGKSGFAIGLASDVDLLFGKDSEELAPGSDYVILPLYSTRGPDHLVPERSGINQWNAAGRKRKLGEAYVSIPSVIHQSFPDFFPSRDVPFRLLLPNQQTAVPAKVCQDNSKALMTTPNRHLGTWLIGVLKPTLKEWMFEEDPGNMQPFDYEDLERIGKDSVRITRSLESNEFVYAIEFAPIGAYEDFVHYLSK